MERSHPDKQALSDKQAEYHAGTEPMLEAIEVDEGDESLHEGSSPDAEKGDLPVVSSQQLVQTTTVQDWNGPDDPDNPHNVRNTTTSIICDTY